jgi:hypothetical protein
MSTARRPPLRTVSTTSRGVTNREMHAFGLLYAAVLSIVLLPLVPFVAAVWFVSWLVGTIRRLGVDTTTETAVEPTATGIRPPTGGVP